MKNLFLTLAVLAFPFGAVAMELDSTVEGTVNVNSTSSTETTVDSDTSVDVNLQGESETNNDVRSQSGASADLKVNALGVQVTSSSQVSSDADVQIFNENTAMMHANVDSVNVDSKDRVEVRYKHKGRLFGFLPVTVTSRTTVEAGADNTIRVKTSLPWWSAMVSGTGEVRNEIQTRVSESAEVKANMSVDASAQAKARVAEAVIATLEAHSQTSASAQVK